MARRPRKTTAPRCRHYAQVVRIRLETAFVEFDHDVTVERDTPASRAAAVDAARDLPNSRWRSVPFDADDYDPFPLGVITNVDVRADAEISGDVDTPETIADVIRYKRVLVLLADVDSGEGELVLQPWFVTDQPDLMMSDIASDWIGELEQLGLTYLSERADEIMSGARPRLSDRMLFPNPARTKPPARKRPPPPKPRKR